MYLVFLVFIYCGSLSKEKKNLRGWLILLIRAWLFECDVRVNVTAWVPSANNCHELRHGMQDKNVLYIRRKTTDTRFSLLTNIQPKSQSRVFAGKSQSCRTLFLTQSRVFAGKSQSCRTSCFSMKAPFIHCFSRKVHCMYTPSVSK